MRTFMATLSVLALGWSVAMVPAQAADPTPAKQREAIQKMAAETLNHLYKVQPSAKIAVKNAAGYAVFSNFGMKILFAGGGKGEGLAVDNKTKSTTYMKMAEVQAGLGMGAKRYRVVWVFEKPESLKSFINSGWEMGAQATAAAQANGKGGSYAGAIAMSPGVWLYQLTKDGLAVELTAKGTKYYKNDKLN